MTAGGGIGGVAPLSPISDAVNIIGEAGNVCGGIDFSDLPTRQLPAAVSPRTYQFQVVFRQSALNQLYRHGNSTTDAEVCGVLVGNVYRDSTGPFLHVEAAIEGKDAASHAAQVKFTANTWTHIFEVTDRDYPDLRIIGWYHTHPGFDIFLSDMDLFTHCNFFNLPWQIAFVYDPLNLKQGLFVWKNGKPVPAEFLIEPDEPAMKVKGRRKGKRQPPPDEQASGTAPGQKAVEIQTVGQSAAPQAKPVENPKAAKPSTGPLIAWPKALKVFVIVLLIATIGAAVASILIDHPPTPDQIRQWLHVDHFRRAAPPPTIVN
jgi:proteasome lid subunit RPN8/RPN11